MSPKLVDAKPVVTERFIPKEAEVPQEERARGDRPLENGDLRPARGEQVLNFSLFASKEAPPRRVTARWQTLAKRLAVPKARRCTLATCKHGECTYKHWRAWSPTAWPRGSSRTKATALSVSTLVLDLDHLTDDALAAALKKLEPYEYVLHSSHSDRPGQRCVRVVLLLSRPVTRAEWERFWPTATAQLGVQVDQHCKDASRLYFLPTRPHDAMHEAADGSGYHYAAHAGALIDVDAILALAPIAKPHEVHEAPAGAGYREPTDQGRATAVRLLGELWPEPGKRHEAYLALAGGLIRAEWPIDEVAQFSFDVVSVKMPDYDDISKRLSDARTSYNKITAGEPATGWPRLVECLAQGEVTADAAQKAVDEVRVALGLVPADDPEFLARMTEAARVPLRSAVRAALESARDKFHRSTNGDLRTASALLSKALSGKPLAEPDEDHEQALKQTALAMVRAAPKGTPAAYIRDLLLPSAGLEKAELAPFVAAAFEQASSEKKKTDERTLPVPADDEELRSQLRRTERGSVKTLGMNTEHILRYSSDTRGLIRFNVFSKRVEISGGRFQRMPPRVLATSVRNWFGSHWDIDIPERETKAQIRLVAELSPYNPVEEYLRKLEWDRKPRLDHWLTTYCGVESTQYTQRVAAQFLISAVARAFEPGCKVDSVLVLHGLQGTNKSMIVEVLGEPWFSATTLDATGQGSNGKDSMMRMSYSWFIELPELTSLIDKDVNRVKAFLTQGKDDFRTPYGEEIETFVRRCVFWGTTNDSEWLQDHTGNRRFWCVSVKSCDVKSLRRDRDQLYAEAVFRYGSAELNPDRKRESAPGERWWFTDEEQIDAEEAISERVVEDPWVSMIEEWLDKVSRPVGAQPPRTRFILAEIAKEALQLSSLEIRKNARTISAAMSAAGMKKLPGKARSGGRTWEYIRPRDNSAADLPKGKPGTSSSTSAPAIVN